MAITPDSFLRNQRMMATLMTSTALLSLLIIALAYAWGQSTSSADFDESHGHPDVFCGPTSISAAPDG